jgi:octaprenyl-diphosphate synthase
MFRPTLALLAAQATGAVGPRQVSLAAVVELIHLATLVHDDSVDHSVLRRGQPTVNAFFSHEIAVIMGDYLYSRAMMELVKGGDIEPMRIMARVTNDMTVGEMRELEAHDALSHTEEDYELMIKAKTASLVSGACELGALSAGDEVRGALKRYGMYLGMAFQVTDDLLDYTGSESVTGKPSGLDLREHKITLPLIAALPRMTREDRALVERLMADPTPSDGLIESVIGVVDARGGLAAAHERAQQFSLQAEAELDAVQPGAARDALRDCLVYAIERRS